MSTSITSSPLLVIGLSRTGGTSLSRALATLGYKNLYDLDDVAYSGPEHANFWLKAVQRKLAGEKPFDKAEFDSLLEGYDGVRNIPAAAFAAELLAFYPRSKVILPIRDVESWHRSCLTTVYKRSSDPLLRLLALVDHKSRTYLSLLRGLQQILYNDDFPNHGKSAFKNHNEYLRESVPSHMLLEYQVQQGWKPLCEFLEKETLITEFPCSNDHDSFWKGCRSRDGQVAAGIMAKFLLVAGIVVLAWWGLPSQ